jgi:hypothetical protein
MEKFFKSKTCTNFHSLEKGLAFSYRIMHSVNCRDCIFFCSRNCGMDTAAFDEPDSAFFI